MTSKISCVGSHSPICGLGRSRLRCHPMLGGINYWDELRDSPSQMETCFANFVNVLELDDSGEPVNEKYAEMRALVPGCSKFGI
jgi:hypothetical protein